jgi:ribosomal protein S12 methylthiotransferase accessory factor YcaO
VRYDPTVPPKPTEWLALNEGEQIALVETYHRRAGINLPNATLHALIHTTVERQLAAQLSAVVDALQRLQAEGLDRHDAIHAIGAVLAEHMRQLMTGELKLPDPNPVYFAALERLSAASWRREYGDSDNAV